MSKMAEYKAIIGAIRRCNSEACKWYYRYGGRGIIVDFQLAEDPWLLVERIGPRPSPDHSLDRIDNDGSYVLDNLRWATEEEQANNKGNNRLIALDGLTQTLAQWCRELGVDYSAVHSRLSRGWGENGALLTPVRKGKKSGVSTDADAA